MDIWTKMVVIQARAKLLPSRFMAETQQRRELLGIAHAELRPQSTSFLGELLPFIRMKPEPFSVRSRPLFVHIAVSSLIFKSLILPLIEIMLSYQRCLCGVAFISQGHSEPQRQSLGPHWLQSTSVLGGSPIVLTEKLPF